MGDCWAWYPADDGGGRIAVAIGAREGTLMQKRTDSDGLRPEAFWRVKAEEVHELAAGTSDRGGKSTLVMIAALYHEMADYAAKLANALSSSVRLLLGGGVIQGVRSCRSRRKVQTA